MRSLLPLFLKVLYFYLKAIFAYYLNLKKDIKLFYCGYCLVEKMSYRLPEKSGKDFFIAFRIFKRVFTAILSKENNIEIFSDSKVAIIEGNFRFMDFVPGYVEKHSGKKTGIFIARLMLPGGNSLSDRFFLCALDFILLTIFCPLTFFSSTKSNLALCIAEIIETTKLLHILKKFSIKEIYDFLPYEKDSNINAYILMREKIKVHKLPSPGPLFTHNRILIADVLITSSQYHMEEIPALKETLFFRDSVKWLPEYSHKYLDKYASAVYPPEKNVIAYYSHGSWLRKKRGDRKSALFNADSAGILLNALAEFLKKNEKIKLVIFPHPAEKNEQNIGEMQKFYDQYFRQVNYSVRLEKTDTFLWFEKADIAVTTYSTIMMERLFCGYKGLFFNYGLNDFPLKGTNLSNISIADKDKLFCKLEEGLGQTNDEFFTHNKLIGYRFSD